MLYDYEVFVGEGKYHEFSSNWKYEDSNQLFIEKDGVTYVLMVVRVTHRIEDNRDVHRLTCHSKLHKNNSL